MIQVILTPEQEQFLQEQLNSGQYTTPEEVITEAFKLLAQRGQPKQKLEFASGEVTQKLLAEKIKKFRQEQEANKNKPIDPRRRVLAEDFRRLCKETQAIPGIQDITEEEIQAEIEAYRRGE